MTQDARAWIAERHGDAAVDRLARFVTLLVDATARHNLISPASVPHVWERHILDSAQLAALCDAGGRWLDIGSGGGLPGMVLALLLPDRPFTLCEPRRLRAAFLQEAVDELGLGDRVTVAACRVEVLDVVADTISARAVAGLDAVLTAARSCAHPATTWILPRGQSGLAEIQTSIMLRHAMFHVEPSLTEPSAVILVARGVA